MTGRPWQFKGGGAVAGLKAGPAGEAVRLAGLIARHALRRAFGRLYRTRLYRWRFRGAAAERLTIAPQDLRTTDPTLAAEFYAGRFAFAGEVVEAGGRSPFDVPPPNAAWAAELNGFAWLRHLRAADRALSRSNARALVADWIAASRRWQPAAWTPEVTARRIIAWISHSPIVLEGADYVFYRHFMRSLARQARYLRRAAADAPEGMPRLTAAIALTQAGLCMSDQARFLRQSTRWLEDELGRQILPDGGHVSRNPGVLVELLLDLLPLRQAFAARGLAPPAALLTAIDRMMPILRFFRHGDGAFALFNGMGATPIDVVAALISYDDTRGSPLSDMPYSGYQRLEAEGCVVIADAGRPPPIAVSDAAHAGALSFELSSGAHRIVVNCGAPAADRGPWRQLARMTAAHSTLAIADTSSCRFVTGAMIERMVGTPILAGPGAVTAERREAPDASLLAMSHDGYARAFGLTHQRLLSLSVEGDFLEGEDALVGGTARARAYSLRFHLHPDVEAMPECGTVRLTLPSGEVWRFAAEGMVAGLEESVFLGGKTRRAAAQIVVESDTGRQRRLRWSFRREVS